MSTELRVLVEATVRDEKGDIIAMVRPITLDLQGFRCCIVHIELKRPIDVAEVRLLEDAVKKLQRYIEGDVLVLSGRGPIWMFATLLHSVGHLFRAVAIFDPKLRGAVVTASHHPKISSYTVIQLPPEVIEQLTQVTPPGGQ